MNEWIGKKRNVPKYKAHGFFSEEIIDIGDTWVVIQTTEKEFSHKEKHDYPTNKELVNTLTRLKYQ